MALSIKDPEADRLARELAALTGETLTEAIAAALRDRLARERRQREAKEGHLAERLMEIGRRCAAHMAQPAASLDHDAMLYDEHGLPK